MLKFWKKALAAALAGCVAGPALAADLYEPPVVEQAPPEVVYQDSGEYGGWYIRGDVDYHWSKMRGANYILYGTPGASNNFDFTNLRGTGSLGLGIGYQASKHLRFDVTGDYWFKTNFRGQTTGVCGAPPVACVSVDTSKMSALLLLANAYADLGTWHGITPYVGAGIGGAYVKWDELNNDNGTVTIHRGGKGWRFAYALMAGASYCLTSNLKLDAGYRFSRIEGGRFFDYANGGGPGFDRGFNTHEVRGGLRYQFGKSDCEQPVPIAYDPPPVYTK